VAGPNDRASRDTGAPANPVGRVLVVDDEPGVREGCRRVLVAEGHAVDVAADARRGLKKVHRDGYDVVLVDIKMPDMSGLEMLNAIRRLDPEAVCVVITGYASYDTAVEATKLGAYDFLAKPFTPEELAVKVARAREHRQALLAAKRAREEAESRLLELDAERGRLRTVVNCMVDGVLVTNREGLLVLHNPAALKMLGLNAADPLGMPAETALPHRELVSAIAQTLAGTGGRLAMTSRELTLPPESPAGAPRSVMANVAPVRDARGQILGAITVLRDVTQIRELDRAKSRFVSLVSHELKAPLGAVQSYLRVLSSGLVASPEERQRILERSIERIDALLGLVNDLLDLSRIEAGRVERRVEPVDVASVVRAAARLLEAQAEAQGIAIHDELPTALPPVCTDRSELERVFTNLLSNAVKYNRPGGVVTLSGAAEGGWVRVAIADTGIGIPAEELPHLFEEFHRVRTPETREVVGTGLGLAIARRLVEAAHGRIEVQSEPGVGSTFSVVLPVAGDAGHGTQA